LFVDGDGRPGLDFDMERLDHPDTKLLYIYITV
jgi:hypothetical protein